MYLRQSDKWKDYLLAEAIENIGLPSRVVRHIRRAAQAVVHSDAWLKGQAEKHGVEAQKIEEKALTWLGHLVKKHPQRLFTNDDARAVANFIKKAVRETSGLDDSSSESEREALGERMVDAIGPLIDYAIDSTGYSGGTGESTFADLKSFKKKMLRALKRAELPEGEIKSAEAIFDHAVMSNFTDTDNSIRAYMRKILGAIALDPFLYEEDLKDKETLRAAYESAQHFLDNPRKNVEQIIHEFDNGYFWYDIRSAHCDFEAKQMGHCGRSENGQLVSLRTGNRKMKPMVTMDFDGKVLYQIKGKANEAPKEDLWPYIEWFIENMGVESIVEADSPMTMHLREKYPDLEWGDKWARKADELLDQYDAAIETDTETSLELDYAAEGDDEEVGVILRHQAYWPILDKVIDEDTDRLIWDIIRPEGEVRRIVEDTLYPNPTGLRAAVFRRGEQDSRTAMLRIEVWWSRSFEPADPDDEESVDKQLERLADFLDEMEEISGYLGSPQAAPEEAEFDYNGFWEGIEDRLKEYGVYRDIAGEIDAEDERYDSPQMELPLQESKRPEPDWFAAVILLRERRIIQRWRKIIK